MTTQEVQGIGKYVGVYVVLLILMALQFIIGYQSLEGPHLVVRTFTFGIIETALVVLFFMNLGSEKPAFVKFLVIFMGFVLLTINYGWTDSFRLLLYQVTKIGPS